MTIFTEVSKKLKELRARKEFMKETKKLNKLLNELSPEDRNKIAGIENERTPEELSALEEERIHIMEELRKEGKFKEYDEIMAARAKKLQENQ